MTMKAKRADMGVEAAAEGSQSGDWTTFAAEAAEATERMTNNAIARMNNLAAVCMASSRKRTKFGGTRRVSHCDQKNVSHDTTVGTFDPLQHPRHLR